MCPIARVGAGVQAIQSIKSFIIEPTTNLPLFVVEDGDVIHGVVVGEGPTIDVVGYGAAEAHLRALSDLWSGRSPIDRSTEKWQAKTWMLVDSAGDRFLVRGNAYINRTLPMLLGVEVDVSCLDDDLEKLPIYRVTYKKGAGPQSWREPVSAD